MIVFYTIMMTLNITCAFLILMSGLRQQKAYLLSLALVSINGFYFHYYSWQFHTATTLSEAIAMSQMQTIFIIISLPLVIFTFGRWCHFRYTNYCSAALLFIAIGLIAVSYFTDMHLRYRVATELVTYTSIFGNELVIVKGELSVFFLLFNVLYALNSGLLIFFAARFFKQKHKLLSVFLSTFLCLQIIANYASYKLDILDWPIFYLGGLPLTLFSLLCTTLISTYYKTKSEQLIAQKEQQVKLEASITRLASGLSTIDSKQFYLELANMIYEFFKADFVMIGGVKEKEQQRIETFIVLRKGEVVNNLSYALQGTACEAALKSEICVFTNNAATSFPDDEILNNEAIESYVGVPILNQDNCPIGIISIRYQIPFNLTPTLIDALKIFSSRAAAEFKRNELEKSLKMMAYYDDESKLPNRRKLLEVIKAQYIECQRNGSNALFMLIDLDNFGDVNHQYGYEVGDKVINQLGSRLQSYSSKDLFIARNSGDEFAIVILDTSCDIKALLDLHWKAIKILFSEPCVIGERRIQMQCCMGAVLFPMQIETQFNVISCAEHSVQRAKDNGRNQFVLFDPDILAEIDWKKEIESDLAAALKGEKELSLAYQPKVTKEGKVIGSEALIRWHHPIKGLISPVDFIPIAEESGLIHSLGKWVANEACRQLDEWRKEDNPSYKVSINVAASQFDDPDFILYIFATLNKYKLDPKYLEARLAC